MVVVVAAFVALVVAKGVPALRHDWWMSSNPDALRSVIAGGLSTWHRDGLGWADSYPDAYAFYALTLGLAYLLSPVWVLAVIAAAIGGLCAVAAATFGRLRGNANAALPLLLVLLFNPWTYTELVAGHVIMLVSYASTAAFVAEAAQGRRASSLRLCLFSLGIAQQLQLLLVMLLGTVGYAVARREWRPCLTIAVSALPVWIGVGLGYHDLSAIPYTLAWERTQSLAFPGVFQMRGYFAHYSAALGPLELVGSTLFAFTALVALVVERSRAGLCTAALVLLIALAASGSNGPLAAAYDFVVTHVHASAVFRELYDLVAFIAIGYALLASLAMRHRPTAPLVLLAGVAMLAAWMLQPPWHFWVPSSSVPTTNVSLGANVRFALLPAFQPMRFEGRGSGPDPDVFDRPNNVVPLNAYYPVYPASTALARLAAGDDTLARALSVGEVVQRPWLCTNVQALNEQARASHAAPASCGKPANPRYLRALPEMTWQHGYAIASLASNLGAGNVLVDDALGAGISAGPDPVRIRAFSATGGTDAAREWIDARLLFTSIPTLGQSYGGIFTTSATLQTVTPDSFVLARIRGRLIDAADGATIARSTHGYAWMAIGSATHAVRCDGACALAAQANEHPLAPLDPPKRRAFAIHFHERLPWLIAATLPPLAPGSLLRLNVTYTPYWSVLPGHGWQHVRIDGAVNGWLTTAYRRKQRVTIVEWRCAAEALAELVACAGLIVILFLAHRHDRTRGLQLS